ncbi:MAG: glycerol-3-phosphate 1-O-acyltransferase PlsY [Desulfosalsimonadaceae bacterium]|nr:glycerol-3-phosphate 1-O-acyltransferase PlsY [Desulfosalsimonadaceae bacterium]
MRIILCLFAYLLGSIPFGLVLAKVFKSVDLRKIGSGNIGATNARRAGGWGLGIATLACDALKGVIPVAIAGMMNAGTDALTGEIWMAATAVCAVAGHLFPVYLKFKTGGKGVATAAGCFAVISPLALSLSLAVFFLVARISNRVSAGSIAAAASLPPGVLWATRSFVMAGCALIISGAIIVRHRDNIKRLRKGSEPPIWGKKG